jgi:hypothetical protein
MGARHFCDGVPKDKEVINYRCQLPGKLPLLRQIAMANETKAAFLKELNKRYGTLHKLEQSQSLFEIGDGAVKVYIRYSKVHSGNRTFYGLRGEDLKKLEGHTGFICFLWDGQTEPLLVPFSDYEEVFQSTAPASDGQYKAQVYLQNDGTELYIAEAGRFNVEGYFGWDGLENMVDSAKLITVPDFSHSQIQTLLGAIGTAKGYDVWVPTNDRIKLDWSVTKRFECRELLPYGFEKVNNILQELDVIWIQRGSSEMRALFEVEHSTPIYSGLLRFNDIHLMAPNLHPRFSIVANDVRRSLFVRQLNRATFLMSGLNELCTFLEYINVLGWYNRIKTKWEGKTNETAEKI